jgi:hypothetical protein
MDGLGLCFLHALPLFCSTLCREFYVKAGLENMRCSGNISMQMDQRIIPRSSYSSKKLHLVGSELTQVDYAYVEDQVLAFDTQ